MSHHALWGRHGKLRIGVAAALVGAAASVGVGAFAFAPSPALAQGGSWSCGLESITMTDGDGRSIQGIVPAPVVLPGSTVHVSVKVNLAYSAYRCHGGMMEAKILPDGRMLDRPWMQGGVLEYSFVVPGDLTGGPEQKLAITTHGDLGATPIANFPFRTEPVDNGHTVRIIEGGAKVVDGKLVLCADQPDVCANTPEQIPEQAAPAVAPSDNASTGAVPASVSPSAPAGTVPATSPDEAELAVAASPRADAPPWIWPGVLALGAAAILVFGGIRIARARDHAASLRRMADRG
ncbi:hypothetical protein [Agromyces badenianii]|uniref:hypothetical protein n=1 Tax=Agromyces badenianii TaxID=2080742 RepID=UPI000D590D4A|nr:hypothetical protein [Agromyces badenianii]PWC04332.1 hypothetical protein DCE94_09290 [Agromyces badenianii]